MRRENLLPAIRRRVALHIEQLEERSMLSYSIVDLHPTGAYSTKAYGINEAGQVVGEWITPSFDHAFVWDAVNGMKSLGTLGGASSRATGINDVGEIAGFSTLANGKNSGFVWDSTNGLKALPPTSGKSSSRAFAINNQGHVAGWSGNQYFIDGQATVWTDATPVALSTIGTKPAQAWAITDKGWVAGSVGLAINNRAVLWSDGTLKRLGTLSQWGSGAFGVNELGDVVGNAMVQDGNWILSHPFLYSRDGGMQDLGTGDCPGGSKGYGVAKAINSHAQIVGYLGCVSGGGAFDDFDYAAVWDATHGWRNLNDLIPPGTGLHLNDAHGINDKGQIIGYGFLNNNLDIDRAFVLTPDSRADETSGRSLGPSLAGIFPETPKLRSTEAVRPNDDSFLETTKGRVEPTGGDAGSVARSAYETPSTPYGVPKAELHEFSESWTSPLTDGWSTFLVS